MPYLTSDQVRIVFEDLPAASVPGRSGSSSRRKIAGAAITLGPARACAARFPMPTPLLSPEALEKRYQRECLKERLSHIKETISTREWQHALKRYQGMSDQYYSDSDPVGPNGLSSHSSLKRFRPKGDQPAELWEIMAGSGALSAGARSKQMTHLPPIDHRWGWHVGRYADQLRLLILQVLIGCGTLFASPSCHPWGRQRARNHPSTKTRGTTQ